MATNQKIFTAIAVIAVVFALGYAGRMDYTEEVIYNMPNEAYRQIKDTLGKDATDYEIAEYFIKKNNNYDK